ncbi:hypothetical protein Cadr_000004201 [Camelus dromedarius]|uniref:Uncharacterized protein n=1 Tax=Camelus dromedarius TaxID=9838 RepID=A0A5N4EBA2_CAMDR|nr:hypothetical protein Cadr_000004201 [Camelus dromedarius]
MQTINPVGAGGAGWKRMVTISASHHIRGNWAQGRGHWQPVLRFSHSQKKDDKGGITQVTLVLPMPEGKSYKTAKGHGCSGWRQNFLASSVDREEASRTRAGEGDRHHPRS